MRECLKTRFHELKTSWNTLWFAPNTSTESLIWFRVSLGALLFIIYLCLSPSWTAYFSYPPDGFADPSDPVTLFYWLNGHLPNRILWALGIIASIGLISGYRAKIWIVLLFLLHVSMVHANRFVMNGEDFVIRFLLFYSCFASFERHDKARPIWPVRLMQVNFALIYFFSLPKKLELDPAWITGDAFYWVMINETWSRFPFPEWFYGSVLSTTFTYLSVLVEALVPLLIWFPKYRFPSVVTIWIFHLGIAIFLKNVTFFSLSMVVGALVFLKDEDIRKIRDLVPFKSQKRLISQ